MVNNEGGIVDQNKAVVSGCHFQSTEWVPLEPGDIILCQTGTEWGMLQPLFKFLVGEWGHAMIYVFDMKNLMGQDIPWFVEARPKKGVSIVSGRNYQGYHIAVLRIKDTKNYGILAALAADEAETRASDPGTLYGFNNIVACVIKLICQKLGKPIKAWKPDKYTICSELVEECYGTIGVTLDVGQGIPLPGDFYTCPQLEKIFEGELVI